MVAADPALRPDLPAKHAVMVNKTPFERLIEEVSQQAVKEPLAAFARLQECYGKSLTDRDVQLLCALAGNLGGALGRWDDTITFLSTLLDHPALEAGGATSRSIWRATAVMQRCIGRNEAAEQAITNGVQEPSDRARIELMTANTLVARSRAGEATPFLVACARQLAAVASGDEIHQQAAAVAVQIARVAELQLHQARQLLVAASETVAAASAGAADWRARHRALYQQSHAWILAGDPRKALEAVELLMDLEDRNDAGPAERFFTASLACRAQRLRGQQRVAQGALEACGDYASRVESGPLAQQIQAVLAELRKEA
jgi:ribosomal protein S9